VIDFAVAEDILNRIQNDEPYTFVTSGQKELQSYGISFSQKESYIGYPSHESDKLLKSLADNPHTISTYDWKTSLRRILFSVENTPLSSL
jgi:hypothetical protein